MVLRWCEVLEAGLVALPVVEHLDEFEQVGMCFGTGSETDAASDPCDLDVEARLERFDGCTIKRVANAPERQSDVGVPGRHREVVRRVLTGLNQWKQHRLVEGTVAAR
jgi:hypothetical protein